MLNLIRTRLAVVCIVGPEVRRPRGRHRLLRTIGPIPGSITECSTRDVDYDSMGSRLGDVTNLRNNLRGSQQAVWRHRSRRTMRLHPVKLSSTERQYNSFQRRTSLEDLPRCLGRIRPSALSCCGSSHPRQNHPRPIPSTEDHNCLLTHIAKRTSLIFRSALPPTHLRPCPSRAQRPTWAEVEVSR